MSADAKEIVKCVKELNTRGNGNYTLIHIMEIFKGDYNIFYRMNFVAAIRKAVY